MTETPSKIIAKMKMMFDDSSDGTYRRLEAEAKSTILQMGQLISAYMARHKTLRGRMHKASYPNIEEETTSVLFAVNGLEAHHAYKDAARALRFAGLPPTLKVLKDRLLQEETMVDSMEPMVLIPSRMTLPQAQHGQ